MPRRPKHPLLPQTAKKLKALGEDIRLARLRRGLAAGLLAERAGIARDTLRALENGSPGVSLGVLAAVLSALGMAQVLETLAEKDTTGRKLQDIALGERAKRRASLPTAEEIVDGVTGRWRTARPGSRPGGNSRTLRWARG